MKYTLHVIAILMIAFAPTACNKVKFKGSGKSVKSSSATNSNDPTDPTNPILTPPTYGECNPELQECCDPNDENYDSCMVDCEENGTCPTDEPTSPPAEDPNCYDGNECPVDEEPTCEETGTCPQDPAPTPEYPAPTPEDPAPTPTPTCEEEGTCPVDPTPTCDQKDDYQGNDDECTNGNPTPGQSSNNPNQN